MDEDGCAEHMNIDHEELNEEGQHSQETGDEGDQDWTPEEAETAYEQAGDDDCGQGPDPKYLCYCHYHLDSLFTHPLFSPQSP